MEYVIVAIVYSIVASVVISKHFVIKYEITSRITGFILCALASGVISVVVIATVGIFIRYKQYSSDDIGYAGGIFLLAALLFGAFSAICGGIGGAIAAQNNKSKCEFTNEDTEIKQINILQ